MCCYSEQSFGFVSPISAQESSKPCRENHQSWMAHQTALQNGTQGNKTICPTAGLPSTYRIQRSQCCSMCSSSRLLWMCLLMSHLGWERLSLECLLPDCLNIPHLWWVRPMERWLASSSHVLGQTNAAGIGIISQGDSWIFHPVLACKGAACDLLSNEPFPYTLATCTWPSPADCIQETLRQKKGRTFSLHTWISWVVLWHVCFKSWVRPMEWWLAILQASSAQCHMSRDRPMLLG